MCFKQVQTILVYEKNGETKSGGWNINSSKGEKKEERTEVERRQLGQMI